MRSWFDTAKTLIPFLFFSGTGWAFRKLSMSNCSKFFLLSPILLWPASESLWLHWFSSLLRLKSPCEAYSSWWLLLYFWWFSLRWAEMSWFWCDSLGGGFRSEYSSLVEGDMPRWYLLSSPLLDLKLILSLLGRLSRGRWCDSRCGCFWILLISTSFWNLSRLRLDSEFSYDSAEREGWCSSE